MKKVCLLILCILPFCSPALLYAQNGNAAGNDLITAISVSGLKRTKLSTAERPLRKFIGVEAGQLDHTDVWAAVLDTGILEPLLVEILSGETEGKILSVTVREKWAIFPVPVFMVDSGGMSAGGALFDANAFGLNDKFFLAGLYLQGGWAAAAGYIHASPGGQIPGWNGMAVYTREEREDVDQRNKVLRRFDKDSLVISAGLSFNLLENPGELSLSPHFSYSENILRNNDFALNGPEDSLRVFGAGLGLSYNKSNWDGYLLSQEEASLHYSFRVAADGFYFQSIGFRGVLEKSLVPGFRLTIRTGLILDPDAPILFESSPFDAQVDILPRSFSARNYAGISAGLEKYLFKISAGTLSLAAVYQMVYSDGSLLGDSLDHGPAGKVSFYLSRLAIPALGLGISYNVKEQYLQGFFSIGMTF